MHHKIYLSEFPGSYLLAAEAEAVETAIVFVHGFLGDAFDTWVDFQSSIDRDDGWEHADLYFFQYDSFNDSVGASVAALRRFLARVEQAPEDWFQVPAQDLPAVIRDTLGGFRLRDGPTAYRQLVLVAHSLGGIVVRQAIVLQAADDRKRVAQAGTAAAPALLRARLSLFAPAINGARSAGLFGVALRLRGLAGLALGASPSYQELLPQTGVVGRLRQRTEELAKSFPHLPAFQAEVLWAGRDDIVVDADVYAADCNHGRAAGTDHVSVCKPGHTYRRPLDLVIRGAD